MDELLGLEGVKLYRDGALESLKRPQLQKLCKLHGVKAAGKVRRKRRLSQR
jgi:hypothetical protein